METHSAPATGRVQRPDLAMRTGRCCSRYDSSGARKTSGNPISNGAWVLMSSPPNDDPGRPLSEESFFEDKIGEIAPAQWD
jgi:hypothetical protein